MRYLIIGAARSGIASAHFLLSEGAEVFLSDTKSELAEAVEAEFLSAKPQFIWGDQPNIDDIQPDMIIMSPGVPLHISPVQRAQALNIPVISETELAFNRADCDFVAITGTNGKTTTTSLAQHLMADGKRQVVAGGNIGIPLISQVKSMHPEDIIVAEMSSFQLESIDAFRPHIATVLNITPDHLDRHGTLEAYRAAKMNVFRNQTKEDYLILNADDPQVRSMQTEAKSQVLFFSQIEKPLFGMWLEGEDLFYRLPTDKKAHALINRREIGIPGDHNLENAMAAACIALLCGYDAESIAEKLRTFKGVAHRMEFVANIGGVRYINDSKGTNPNATEKAIRSYENPLVLIVGGRNKGIDFAPLSQLMAERCRSVIVMGEATEDFLYAFSQTGFQRHQTAGNMKEAVALAVATAQNGDVVLLSPACTSWDQYRNFEERGDAFKKLVNEHALQNKQ